MVKKWLSYLWSLLRGVGALGLLDQVGGGDRILTDGGGVSLVRLLPVGTRTFEDRKQSGIGFLLWRSGMIFALS